MKLRFDLFDLRLNHNEFRFSPEHHVDKTRQMIIIYNCTTKKEILQLRQTERKEKFNVENSRHLTGRLLINWDKSLRIEAKASNHG